MQTHQATHIRPVYFSYGNPPPAHLSLFAPPVYTANPPARKLYLVPTPDFLEGEELDELPPIPSHLTDLPDIAPWVRSYIQSIIEIWMGRRPAAQLMRWTHNHVYSRLTRDVASRKVKLNRIHISQPVEGVCEALATVIENQRVRSVMMRFEGADKKWKCTVLELI